MLTGKVWDLKSGFGEIENISKEDQSFYGELTEVINQKSLSNQISSQFGYIDIYEVSEIETVHVGEIGDTWLEKENKHDFERRINYYLIPDEIVIIEAENYPEAANIISDAIKIAVKEVQFDFSKVIHSERMDLVSADVYNERDGTYSRIHGKHIDFDSINPDNIVNGTINIKSGRESMTLQLTEDGRISSESLHQNWLDRIHTIKSIIK